MILKVRVPIIFALILLLSLSQAIAIGQPAVSQQSPNLHAIDTYLEAKLRQYRIPGLAIAIVQDNRIIHQESAARQEAASLQSAGE